jgi:hypothetical protein
MMVLVLGMAVMGTSAYAVCPDPDHITPWRYNGDPTPAGDDDPFGVDKSRGMAVFDNFCVSSGWNACLLDAFLQIVVQWENPIRNNDCKRGNCEDREHSTTPGQ